MTKPLCRIMFLMAVHHVGGFMNRQQSTKISPSNVPSSLFFASQQDNDRGTAAAPPNGSSNFSETTAERCHPCEELKSARQQQKKRQRSPDFPSMFYNTRGVKANIRSEPVRIRFRDENGVDRTLNKQKPPKSRIVNVPQPPEEKPLLKRLFLSSIGASLEPVIFDTDRLLPTAKRTRLLTGRTYARKEPFAAENVTVPPSLDDLAAIPRVPFEGFWISSPYRLGVFLFSYCIFPYLTRFLDTFVTMSPSDLDDITSKFAPGISILYGTFISLTLSILYNRQRDIQDHAATESSLLVIQIRTLLNLFKDNRELSIEAGQCVADQIRTLVRSSRGAELMLLMYSDPYSRILELIDRHEDDLYQKQGNAHGGQAKLAYARDVVKDLFKMRTARLSDECQALPPTHFLILNSLTLLILLGYTISILPTVPLSTGEPSNESSLLFGSLAAIYVLFYDFANDLNNPFTGVYQVRRSCTASHLLEAKWLIANHPYLRGEVEFDEVYEEPECVQIRSPGLGDFWFERNDIYLDADNKQSRVDNLG